MGKSRHAITNWSQYNKSLVQRGSLTFWVDAEAMKHWFHQDHHGRRGRSPLYTDQTIDAQGNIQSLSARNSGPARLAV